jgi:hypothetical protein
MSTYGCSLEYPKKPYPFTSVFARLVFLLLLIYYYYLYFLSILLLYPLLLLALALPAICSVIIYESIHPTLHFYYRIMLLSLINIKMYLFGLQLRWKPFSEALKKNASIELPPPSQPLKRSLLLIKPTITLIMLVIISPLIIFILLLALTGLLLILFQVNYPKLLHKSIQYILNYYYKLLCYGLLFLTDELPSLKLHYLSSKPHL